MAMAKMDEQLEDIMIETPEASTVENIIPAEYWATLPDIERKRLENIYKRDLILEQMGEYFN